MKYYNGLVVLSKVCTFVSKSPLLKISSVTALQYNRIQVGAINMFFSLLYIFNIFYALYSICWFILTVFFTNLAFYLLCYAHFTL